MAAGRVPSPAASHTYVDGEQLDQLSSYARYNNLKSMCSTYVMQLQALNAYAPRFVKSDVINIDKLGV